MNLPLSFVLNHPHLNLPLKRNQAHVQEPSPKDIVKVCHWMEYHYDMVVQGMPTKEGNSKIIPMEEAVTRKRKSGDKQGYHGYDLSGSRWP